MNLSVFIEIRRQTLVTYYKSHQALHRSCQYFLDLALWVGCTQEEPVRVGMTLPANGALKRLNLNQSGDGVKESWPLGTPRSICSGTNKTNTHTQIRMTVKAYQQQTLGNEHSYGLGETTQVHRSLLSKGSALYQVLCVICGFI